jgi:hypothetical protein
MDTMIAGQDRLILFGNPHTAAAALQQFEIPLDRRDGKVSLGAQVSLDSLTDKRRKRSVGMDKKASAARLNPITGHGNQSSSGTAEKKPMNRLNHPLPGSDYQPLGGVDKKPSVRFNNSMPGSDYQPMGARQKSVKLESKPVTFPQKQPFPSTQHYVPRGAARIHPMSQTPIIQDNKQQNDSS